MTVLHVAASDNGARKRRGGLVGASSGVMAVGGDLSRLIHEIETK